MNRFQLWISCAVAVSLAASVLALARGRGPRTGETPLALEERLAALEAERSAVPTPAPSDGDRALAGGLAELSARLDRLESVARRVPVEAVARLPAPSAMASDATVPASSPDAGERRELEALLALFGPDYDFKGTPEQMQRFYALVRDKGLLDLSIAELEDEVAAEGADLDARMELADLYVAKLMTIPHGPEQGIWGDRAEGQWRAVTERDPDHWRANFSLGHNYAFYPDVLGKTREAIHYLEEARRIQENGQPGEHEVRVYLALSRLHSRQGDGERARAVLESGLRRHPSNAEIRAALEDLDR